MPGTDRHHSQKSKCRRSARVEKLRDGFQTRRSPAAERQSGHVFHRDSSRDRIPVDSEETKPCTFNPPTGTIALRPNTAANYARASRVKKAFDRSPCLSRQLRRPISIAETASYTPKKVSFVDRRYWSPLTSRR